METDILKHFIGKDVEVLVSGVWIEGNLMPIAKGIIVLTPIGGTEAFYGPASMSTSVVQAIRQVKREQTASSVPLSTTDNAKIRSSLESNTPGRFVIAK